LSARKSRDSEKQKTPGKPTHKDRSPFAKRSGLDTI
jgi:hypothetical protein